VGEGAKTSLTWGWGSEAPSGSIGNLGKERGQGNGPLRSSIIKDQGGDSGHLSCLIGPGPVVNGVKFGC